VTDYFVADLHLGHDYVARLRGFGTTEAHDIAVLASIADTMKPSDTLWNLGDTNRGSNHEHALDLLVGLRHKQHLIAGNHDACHPMHRRAHLHQSNFLTVFESVQTFAKRRHEGRDILLSHFPYDGDHTEGERFSQWRLRNEGAPLIHRHTHQTTPTDPTRPNQVCVPGVRVLGRVPAPRIHQRTRRDPQGDPVTTIELTLILWASLAIAGISVGATLLAIGGAEERPVVARIVVFSTLAPITIPAFIAWAFVAYVSTHFTRKDSK
jgi:calcineurin-like phosphoesterase family protein